jgi:hypothetical protein
MDKIAKKHGLKIEARVAAEDSDRIVSEIENYFDGDPSNLAVLFGEVIEDDNRKLARLLDEAGVLCAFDARGDERVRLTSPSHATHDDFAGIMLCEAVAEAARRHAQLYFARLPSTRHATSAFIAATYDLHASHEGKATKATADAIKPRMLAAVKNSRALADELTKILLLGED